ncbi:MAG: hypothetical protein V1678_01010 [Candidatus Aenigmatarchaeota archaeon]
MPIIADEAERMITRGYAVSEICDGLCNDCAKEASRALGIDSYIQNPGCQILSAYANRLVEFGKKDKTYSSLVAIAEKMLKDSVEPNQNLTKIDSIKAASAIEFLGQYEDTEVSKL